MSFLDNFAQSSELIDGVCTVDGIVQPSTEACLVSSDGILNISTSLFIPIIFIMIVFLGIWAFSFKHVIQNPGAPNRQLWIIALLVSLPLFLFWLVPIIYYFSVIKNYQYQAATGYYNQPYPPAQPTPTGYVQNTNPQQVVYPNQNSNQNNQQY